jgi:hypothetical protein
LPFIEGTTRPRLPANPTTIDRSLSNIFASKTTSMAQNVADGICTGIDLNESGIYFAPKAHFFDILLPKQYEYMVPELIFVKLTKTYSFLCRQHC